MTLFIVMVIADYDVGLIYYRGFIALVSLCTYYIATMNAQFDPILLLPCVVTPQQLLRNKGNSVEMLPKVFLYRVLASPW